MAVVLSEDCQLRRVIVAGLGELGCSTYDAASQAEVLAYAAQTPIDIVVVDGERFETVGPDAIRRLVKNQPQLHILYLFDGVGETERGRGVAADASLPKPFQLADLTDIVSTWLAYRVTLEQVTDLSIH